MARVVGWGLLIFVAIGTFRHLTETERGAREMLAIMTTVVVVGGILLYFHSKGDKNERR